MKFKRKSKYESKIESLKTQNEIESKIIKELLSPAEFKKKSKYESKIESLKTQNEIESKTIKELLSPAAFEKLKKAQSALSLQDSTRRHGFFYIKSEDGIWKKRGKTIWDRRLNSITLVEQNTFQVNTVERVEKAAELQGIFGKTEKEAGKYQLAFTMEPKSLSVKMEPKEVEPLEAESYELWEPKVELLEGEEDVPVLHLPNSAVKQEPKENEGLPFSYFAVEQLSRVVGLKQEPGIIEESPFQMQIFQLSAVPVEGMSGLIEIKKEPESSQEVPVS